MLSNEYALVKLFALVPKITGRKKLQKTIYLLQQAGVSYNQRFRYHHYGPYSAELQAEIDRLVDRQLLIETYDNVTYTYKITEEGSLFLQKYEEVFDDVFELPQDAVKKLVATNTAVLEMASTYAYLLEMGYKQEDALVKTTKLKPHLDGYLDKAQALFKDLS